MYYSFGEGESCFPHPQKAKNNDILGQFCKKGGKTGEKNDNERRSLKKKKLASAYDVS